MELFSKGWDRKPPTSTVPWRWWESLMTASWGRQGSKWGREREDGLRAAPHRLPISCSQRITRLPAKNQIKSSSACVPLPVCLCGSVQGCQGAMVKPSPYSFQTCESCFLPEISLGISMGPQIRCFQNCVILQTSKAKPPPNPENEVWRLTSPSPSNPPFFQYLSVWMARTPSPLWKLGSQVICLIFVFNPNHQVLWSFTF